MKKLAVITLCLATFCAAGAQTQLLKEVKKSAKTFADAKTQMQPVLTNPETMALPEPYFFVGELGFKEFDNQIGQRALGKPVDEGAMAQTLVEAYGYMDKAIANADNPDAKGKIDKKSGPKAVNIVAGHYRDFQGAGVQLWNNKDFQGSIDAWQIYLDMPNDQRLAAAKLVADPDSITSSVIFNQGLAYYNLGQKIDALNKFLEAKDKGFDDKNVYDFALSVAQEVQRPDTILAICEEALPKYGKEDNIYMINIINVYNNKGEFQKAEDLVAQALAQEPDNAELYRVQGYLYEYNKDARAFDSYKTAYEKMPNDAQMAYDYARQLYNRASEIEDATPTEQYNKVRAEQLIPIYKQALEIVNAAYPNINAEKYPTLEDSLNNIKDLLEYKLS